ncbi:MAG: hypothetical protein KC912_09580 [Proteobacteria bacterium]|nr:hypothetical protein [Pseudomonadota bacterium]
MSEKMSGVQTATIEPPKREVPWIPLGIGAAVLLGLGAYFFAPGSTPAGPWPSTGPIPSPSTCAIDKGMGAVPDVVATDCHPAELAEKGILPEPYLRIAASKVSMTRTHGDDAVLSIRYEGATVDDAALSALMDQMASEDDERGEAGSLSLPSWWTATTSWAPSWKLPSGEGKLFWAQSPPGDLSCHEGPAAGAMVFRDGDALIVHRWRERRECLWKQMRGRGSGWKKPGFGVGFGGGGFGGR